MPPHCDTLDGPLVLSAMKALDEGDVNIVLTWVPESAEDEIKEAFDRTVKIRDKDDETREVADRWFFETVVRLHREGEGAYFTGLKPAGLDTGPVIPLTEVAYESRDTEEVIEFLQKALRKDIEVKFQKVIETSKYRDDDVKSGREHINALLDYMTHSHHLYVTMSKATTH